VAKSNIDKRVWKGLRAKLEAAEKAHVKVGILASKGGASQHDAESGLTVCQVAAFNEYGTKTIPERPFLRSTFAKKDAELGRLTGRLAKNLVEGKMSLARALDVLGLWGATAVKKTITTGKGVPPPNAASTIKAKGSSRTLVDTGRLLGAVSWEVVDAGAEGVQGYKK
jgi:hypothetical protein